MPAKPAKPDKTPRQAPPPAVLFDDAPASLAPLVDLRASFEVRTGALTTIERAETLLGESDHELAGVWARPGLEALVRETVKLPVCDAGLLKSVGHVLLVSGRCPILPDAGAALARGHALVERESSHVIAAHLDAASAEVFLRTGALPTAVTKHEHDAPALLHHPWDVIRFRDACIDVDLQILGELESQELPGGVLAIGEHDVTISPDAVVYPMVVLDASEGPIVIDEHATVRPGAIIIGPAYIGRGSTVLDRALIKAHTAIGPVCKVAGEVGGTIFQGYANKGHDGHLGDSWIGAWANLGAGTTNSNLLNTYDQVIAQAAPDAPRVRTGLQFLGCVLGDHVKTAIQTRLMTGAMIGTGSMLAAMTPPTAVGRFEWVTDSPAGVKRQPYRLSKFIEVARAAMGRRKIVPSDAYAARLGEIAPA
jgi:UDP-N-acetylglucosamine diphosphorylase / glucose-1-phosphate thymidylyltransferase / UDP-N-acetylgalactosamine diphosphorylase / glucosamine-1-phosphate N-acetyltransferase / galactosamine-1-phosphate N-acetyltransferase